MTAYVVMEPPGGGAEKAVFVRDGFAFLAFILPLFWFLWHRLWIEAALALAALLLLGRLDAFGGATGPLLSLLFSWLVGLEAPTLHLAALRRRGWVERGVIAADSLEDAETRFFLGKEDEAAKGTPSTPAPWGRAPTGPGRGALPALGFLGLPDQRPHRSLPGRP